MEYNVVIYIHFHSQINQIENLFRNKLKFINIGTCKLQGISK